MAGIDHTIIAFHNGKLMRELYCTECGEYVSLIPFEYTRDGEIFGVEFDKKVEIPEYYSNTKFGNWIVRRFGTLLAKAYVYLYKKDAVEILVYKSEDYNATFYMDGDESYVLLGGYGHYRNPYTHFYHRGYGEDFERKMAKECYFWLCEDVLEDILTSAHPYGTGSHDEEIERVHERLHFKSYFEMTPEERQADIQRPMLDYDR